MSRRTFKSNHPKIMSNAMLRQSISKHIRLPENVTDPCHLQFGHNIPATVNEGAKRIQVATLTFFGFISRTLRKKSMRTRVTELRRQLKEAERQLKEEEERGKELQKHFEELRDQPKGWYEADVDELDLNQVEELKGKLLELRTSLLNYRKEIRSGEAGSST
ncbi:hypothetical protein ACLB2K_024076 [Fragaria x ananassa]